MSWLSKAHNANEMGPIGDWHKKVRGVDSGGKKKKKKSGKDGSSSASSESGAPEAIDPHAFDRNVLEEGRQGLQLMDEAYPRILANQQKYGGAFARNEVDIASQRSQAERDAINANGKQNRQAILDASPEISKANTSIMDRLNELGASKIEQNLNAQALGDLALGGRLSADDTRESQQAARAGMQARGLNRGQGAAVAEVLNRQQFSEGRLNQRRGFASAVDAQTQARKANDSSIANNAFNTLGAFWDPQARMFGHGGSQVSGQISGPNSYAPYLGAAQDVGKTNQMAQTGIAMQNQKLQQELYGFNVNREDSNYWNMMNMNASNANAAAQQKQNNTNGWISAAGSVLAIAAMAFL